MSDSFDIEAMERRHEEAIEDATAGFVADHVVGGESVEAATGERFETIDPSVATPITTVARGDAADVNAAVEAANEAAESWGAMTPFDRADHLRAWADELRDHVDELSRLETLDTGKPLDFARAEVTDAIDFVEYYTAIAQGHEGRQLPQGADNHAYTVSEPYGVAGQILPWNYPLVLFGWKTGAALAAGNTTVVKPSEEAPLSITRAVQLGAETLPAGVLNVVNGYGEEAGASLTEHVDVDKLSFTGSVPVGQQVMRAAADQVTPVTLELGGKSPFIVFPDADLTQAARTAAAGIFYNTGQSCDACSRILVHEEIHDEFVDEFTSAAGFWAPGDPLESGTRLGPLAFGDQFEKVENYVEVGREEGAEVVMGGEAAGDGDGYFFQPTLFDDVDNDSRIAQEEIFGPVECVVTFSDYEEAIELANDVEYGLAGGVATSDLSLAHRAAADIEAGSIRVNQWHEGGVGVPFGGYKASGFGRECAKEALDDYTHTKAVNVSLGPVE